MIRLTVVSGARAGYVQEFAQPVVRIGRGPDNHFPMDAQRDLDASTNHAEIRALNGLWVLVDLQSRNGLFLATRAMMRVNSQPLSHGDEFQLGVHGPRIRVEIAKNPPAQASAAPPGLVAPMGGPPGPSLPLQPSPIGAQPPQQSPYVRPQGPEPNMIGGMPNKPMGQKTLLAQVGAMLNAKRGKSTQEIRALVDTNVRQATSPLKVIIALLGVLVLAAAGAIVFLVLRQNSEAEARIGLQKQLEQTPMDDPARPAMEKQLGAVGGRKIYDDNKGALFMLVSRQGNRVSGFCTAFAIKPRMIASNAHCAKAAQDLVAKGATIWAHLNESTKNKQPKMFRISKFAGHPRYKDEKKELSPDVGLFELAEEDSPKLVKIASKNDLRALGTGDDLFVIGFPGRVMDELSPVATFMFSHVGRITDGKGQEASKFEDAWLIQHEGMTTPGTSGSPIFNGNGEVVAINAGGLLEANTNDAVYKYAMRIDLLDDVKL